MLYEQIVKNKPEITMALQPILEEVVDFLKIHGVIIPSYLQSKYDNGGILDKIHSVFDLLKLEGEPACTVFLDGLSENGEEDLVSRITKSSQHSHGAGHSAYSIKTDKRFEALEKQVENLQQTMCKDMAALQLDNAKLKKVNKELDEKLDDLEARFKKLQTGTATIIAERDEEIMDLKEQNARLQEELVSAREESDILKENNILQTLKDGKEKALDKYIKEKGSDHVPTTPGKAYNASKVCTLI